MVFLWMIRGVQKLICYEFHVRSTHRAYTEVLDNHYHIHVNTCHLCSCTDLYSDRIHSDVCNLSQIYPRHILFR